MQWLAPIGLIVLVLAVYLPSVITPFPFMVEEDVTFTLNPYMAAPTLENWWGLVSRVHYVDYTPVGWTLQFVMIAIVGVDNVPGIRMTSVLLHLGIVLMMWRLLVAWVPRRPWLTWMVAAIYAVHPMSVEQVIWTPAQKWMLSVLLALIAMRIYWHARGGTPAAGAGPTPSPRLRPGLVTLAVVLFLLALLSKGGVVIVPVLLLTAEWTIGRSSLRRAIWRTVPFFLVAIAFGLFSISQHTEAPTAPFVGGSRIASVVTHLPALARTIGHWMLPFTIDISGIRSPLSFYYYVPVVHDTASWLTAAGVGALGFGAVIGLWWAAGRTRVATLAAVWFLLCEALVLGLFAHQWWHMADRYTCLGGGGLVLLIGCAVRETVVWIARAAGNRAATVPGHTPVNRLPEMLIGVPVLALALVLAGNALAQWMWLGPMQFHWQNLSNEPDGLAELPNVTMNATGEFYKRIMKHPLDQSISDMDVPIVMFEIEMDDPRLTRRIPSNAALAEILATHGAEDLLYEEVFTDNLLLAAVEESNARMRASPSGLQTRSAADDLRGTTDGPIGDRLMQFINGHAANPRVALRGAIYQLCRNRADLAVPWLEPWRTADLTSWRRLEDLVHNADVRADTPNDKLPDTSWFLRQGDYVLRNAVRAEFGLYGCIAARVWLQLGKPEAARLPLQVMRIMFPPSPLCRAWLKQVEAMTAE